MGDLRDGEPALGRLSAGHRDRVVVKNLVGDVDAGRRRRPQRQQAGMGVGAVAEILKDVRFVGEGRLTDPGHALGAHMRDRRGAPAGHRQRHAVAADAGHRAAAFRHLGRGVVRAAGAEIGRPLQRHRSGRVRWMLKRFEPGQSLFQVRALVTEPAQARDQRRGDHGRRELAFARQQRRALFVAFADHGRTL